MVKQLLRRKAQQAAPRRTRPRKGLRRLQAAIECTDRPSVIIAKTIKGYGVGEGGEGRNVTHNQKKLNEAELREFRTRFGIPISDERVAEAPFYRPPEDSPEMVYLARAPRSTRRPDAQPQLGTGHHESSPQLGDYEKSMAKLVSKGPRQGDVDHHGLRAAAGRSAARQTRSANTLCPSCPDESRTFGMEGLFRQIGIYAHAGQHYEPVDSDQIAYYKEAKDGQLLEEGITEAGSMSSFIAAGTSYASHGVNMIPMFIYYSMFGFQRIGDLIWAAADVRAKGFMLGGTAGRTTLNGEGLQHQDGHSLINAMAFPTVRAYDPAYAYETAVIIFDGLRGMYEENETAIYYITLENENYLDARDARRPGRSCECRRGHHPRHVPSRQHRSRRPPRPTLWQRTNSARGLRASTITCRELRHRQRCLERHQLQPASPRRARVPTLEYAQPRQGPATILLRGAAGGN